MLRHAVDPVRLFSLPGWPDHGEAFVGPSAHQERVWQEQKLVEVFLDIHAVEWKNLLPKIRILPTHHAIDRYFSFYNYFSHLEVSFSVRHNGNQYSSAKGLCLV